MITGNNKSSKLRLLIFHPALAPYRVDLFNELSEQADLLVVFQSKNHPHLITDQDELRSRLKCRHEYLTRGLNICGRQIRYGLSSHIERWQPNVIVGTEYSATSLYLACARKWHKREWGFAIHTDDNIDMLSKHALVKKMKRSLIIKHTDALIVTSEKVKEWYSERYIDEKRIDVCPIIHNEHIYREGLAQAIKQARSVAAEACLENKKVCMYVGRLTKVKNLESLIKCFSEASRENPDAVLVIIGEGFEEEKLKYLAYQKELAENIIFLGKREGLMLKAWYNIGQVFILPSTHEPYGAVVNEALLAGMPVLCSEIAGAAHLITDGKNGYKFNPYESSSLEMLIKKTLKSIKPLKCKEIQVRESLMPISFQSAVDGFMHAIEAAMESE